VAAIRVLRPLTLWRRIVAMKPCHLCPEATRFPRPFFGDGSDGELYRANGETLELEETTYQFTNVNLDAGSLVTIRNALSGASGEIRVNSLGVCNLLGDINLSGYEGLLTLNCYSGITIAGNISHPDGSLAFNTYESYSAGGGEDAAVTISNGELVIPDSLAGSLNVTETGDVQFQASCP
jgi:hypothetical protein